MQSAVTLSPVTPSSTLDRSALLASLTVAGTARTAKGFAYRQSLPRDVSRPFTVSPSCGGIVTVHASPALAIARLVSL